MKSVVGGFDLGILAHRQGRLRHSKDTSLVFTALLSFPFALDPLLGLLLGSLHTFGESCYRHALGEVGIELPLNRYSLGHGVHPVSPLPATPIAVLALALS